MTGGLFRAHGVFFGTSCAGPSRSNPKGYVELPWLKAAVRGEIQDLSWPVDFFERLHLEGWAQGAQDSVSTGGVLSRRSHPAPDLPPWGVKVGAQHWQMIRQLAPTVIVLCYRPLEQVMRSRSKIRHMADASEALVRRQYDNLGTIAETANCPVFWVETPRLAQRDYHQIIPAFDALGIEFDERIADAWIEPDYFNRA